MEMLCDTCLRENTFASAKQFSFFWELMSMAHEKRVYFRIYQTETIYWYFEGKFERLTYICSYNSMNIFCYFNISHVASVWVMQHNYTHGERNKIGVFSSYPAWLCSSYDQVIRVIQLDYEKLIRQNLLGIEKSSSKDYFELSSIWVKRWQL